MQQIYGRLYKYYKQTHVGFVHNNRRNDTYSSAILLETCAEMRGSVGNSGNQGGKCLNIFRLGVSMG